MRIRATALTALLLVVLTLPPSQVSLTWVRARLRPRLMINPASKVCSRMEQRLALRLAAWEGPLPTVGKAISTMPFLIVDPERAKPLSYPACTSWNFG